MGELGEDEAVPEAKSHDPCVLPHHYDAESIDDMFPKVKVSVNDVDEFPDFDPENPRW